MRKILWAALAASILVPSAAVAQAAAAEAEAAYSLPRGHNYRQLSGGETIAPALYKKDYWIENFAERRLPDPGRTNKYVRYGNDALLVNPRNGTVLRVYRDLFK